VVAASYGLLVNKPVKVRGPASDDELGLKQLVEDDDRWANPSEKARRRVAKHRNAIIAHYRTANERKAERLIVALWAEVGAVLSLAVAVGLILLDST
jgi:hypothetical protein